MIPFSSLHTLTTSFSSLCTGSAISIGSPVLALFQQLGIYEDLVSVGLRYTGIAAHKENLEPYPLQDFTPLDEL